MLKAYFDESYDGPRKKLFCLGGYAGPEAEWVSFADTWADKGAGAVFHMADLVGLQHGGGDFYDWPKPRRDALICSMVDSVNSVDVCGFHCAIPVQEFAEVFPQDDTDAPYFFCFQLCIGQAAKWAEQLQDQIAIYFDLQDEYEYQAHRMFRHLQKLTDRPGWEHMRWLSSITFGSKRKFIPLQAADLIAYTGFRLLSERMAGRGMERLWWIQELGKKKNIHGELWGRDKLLELRDELRIAKGNGILPMIIKAKGEAK